MKGMTIIFTVIKILKEKQVAMFIKLAIILLLRKIMHYITIGDINCLKVFGRNYPRTDILSSLQ